MRSLVAVEAAITRLRWCWSSGPALALAALSLRKAGIVRQVLLIVGALMVLGWVRAADLLRPIVARVTRNAPGGRWTRPRSPRPNARCGAPRSRSRSAAGCCGRRPPSTSRCTSRRAACSPGRRRSASPHHLSARRRGGGCARRAVGAQARRRAAAGVAELRCLAQLRQPVIGAGSCQTAGMLLAVAHAVERGADLGVHRADLGPVGHAAGADGPGAADPDARLVRIAAAPHRRHRTLLRDRGAQPGRRAGRRGRIPTPSPRSARRKGYPTACRAIRRWRARSPSSRSR